MSLLPLSHSFLLQLPPAIRLVVAQRLLRTAPILHPIRSYRTKSTSPSNSPRSAKLSTISSAPQDLPPLPIIPHGSQHHSSLPTFLAHAARTSLSPTSPTFIGTHYEYTVLSALSSLGFTLIRTGRSSDNGIDLLGTWSVPSYPVPIRVLLQCKNHSRALRPEHVRELEGAFSAAPAGWKGDGIMGFLVSPKEASRGVRDAIGRSSLPLGFLMVDTNGNGTDKDIQVSEGDTLSAGKVCQFLWNHEAGKRGLEGLGVTMRYSGNDEVASREVALTWNGWAIKRTDADASGSLEKLSIEKTEPVKRKRGRPRKDAGEIMVAEQVSKQPESIPVKAKTGGRKIRPKGQKKKT